MAGEMRELASMPLGQAIISNDVRTVRKLIKQGEDAFTTDRKGNTYLHVICTMHKPLVCHVLVAAGLDINAQNKDGNTPLHVTALHNDIGHLKDLLMRGVDTGIRNKNGKTAQEVAIGNKYWHSIYEAFQPGLRDAIASHDVAQVAYLLGCWCSVDTVQDGRDVRQFAAYMKFHDIVALIDQRRFILMAIYAVLESDMKKLHYALSRTDLRVSFPQQIKGGFPRHILQHAIRTKHYNMVRTLVEAGADVNAPARIHDYFWGPLYFESMQPSGELDVRITRQVIVGKADLSLRDEKGRTALIFAIDRTSGDLTRELVTYFLENDINVAARDDTGCSARNVALLSRRRDLLKLIDQHLVDLIKSSNIARLQEMARESYEDFIIELKARDSWIYAAGNETDDVTKFLEDLPTYEVYPAVAVGASPFGAAPTKLTESFRMAIRHGELSTVKRILAICENRDMLLHCKDKGGRGILILSVLWERLSITKFIIDECPELVTQDLDHVRRSALHYAYAIHRSDPEVTRLLLQSGAEINHRDGFQALPADYQTTESDGTRNWILKERKAVYGMGGVLSCLSKYEELLRVIYSKHKGMDHFNHILKGLGHPVADLQKVFMPHGNPLVSDYKDLLCTAVKFEKEHLARKLVHLGCDVAAGHQNIEDKSAMELAQANQMTELVEYMEKIRKIRTDKQNA